MLIMGCSTAWLGSLWPVAEDKKFKVWRSDTNNKVTNWTEAPKSAINVINQSYLTKWKIIRSANEQNSLRRSHFALALFHLPFRSMPDCQVLLLIIA